MNPGSTVGVWQLKNPLNTRTLEGDKQQDRVNQDNGVWMSRYRLFLLNDKSGFPRKAAMNLKMPPQFN